MPPKYKQTFNCAKNRTAIFEMSLYHKPCLIKDTDMRLNTFQTKNRADYL